MYSYNNIVEKCEPLNKHLIEQVPISSTPKGITPQQRRIDPRVDVVVVDNFLSNDECDSIIDACEKVGYTFWRQRSAGINENICGGCEPGDTEARAFRVVDTIEANLPQLAQALSTRIQKVVSLESKSFRPDMGDADEFHQRDLEGTWEPLGLAENLLLGRYGPSGHFSPHMDGTTIVDLNTRSFYTLLIYLNDCETGGETIVFSGEQKDVLQCDPVTGKYVGRVENRVGAVQPRKGSAAFFYYDILHEGFPVGEGCEKYILRGDFLYRRNPPILTSEKDQKAFELYERARVVESSGDAMLACDMFQRVRKLSPGVAELYQL